MNAAIFALSDFTIQKIHGKNKCFIENNGFDPESLIDDTLRYSSGSECAYVLATEGPPKGSLGSVVDGSNHHHQ